MKILYAADLHSDDFTNSIDIIQEVAKECDFAISLGDCNYTKNSDFIDLCYENNLPLLGILGNHDNFNQFNDKRIIDLHQLTHEIDGIIVAGVSGSILYSNNMVGEIVHTQEESIDIFDELHYADIILSHDGPYPQADYYDHIGSKGLEKYIKDKKPKIVFHGHFHKNEVYLRNKTIVYCLYGIGTVDINEQDVDVIWEGMYT